VVHRQRALATSGTLFLALLPCTSNAAAQTYATLYSFAATANDGGLPTAPLVADTAGVLYGTTQSGGGTSYYGTVFSLTPPQSPGGAWTEAVLYAFAGGSDGEYPSGLVIGSGPSGPVLYGATNFGGNSGGSQCEGVSCGTVFSLTPPASPGGSWTKTILYNFMGGSDGAFPLGTLAIGRGVLYGTTSKGGIGHGTACASPGCGTVYSLTPPSSPDGTWTETVLYTFAALAEGAAPQAGVVIGKDGVLFGTTLSGGPGTCGACAGTVFALYPPASPGGPWPKKTLYTFQGPPTDGEGPSAALVIGAGGVLYGTTSYGGRDCELCGTVYSLTPPASPEGAWTEAVLHTFPSPAQSFYNGYPGVVIGAGGALYGTSTIGGSATNSTCWVAGSCGTVFSLTPPAGDSGSWTGKVLHNFAGPPTDGDNPYANVVMGKDGVLFGTTWAGGASNAGSVFALQP